MRNATTLRWVSLSDCAERFRNRSAKFRNRSAQSLSETQRKMSSRFLLIPLAWAKIIHPACERQCRCCAVERQCRCHELQMVMSGSAAVMSGSAAVLSQNERHGYGPRPLQGLIGNATTFCAEFRWAIALSNFEIKQRNFEIAQRNCSATLSSKCRRVSY